MNASATMRNAYVRASVINIYPSTGLLPIREIQCRPMDPDKLRNFKKVDHLQHREACEKERMEDIHKHTEIIQTAAIEENQSFMEFDDENKDTPGARIRKMFTRFPYRDPIYLVAVIFALGSLDLVIDGIFDLLPLLLPSSEFETRETIAIPTTVLIGSVFFFVAGIFDVFGALNADNGTLESSKEDLGPVEYKSALVGSPEFKWIPSKIKFLDLLTTNLAFQAGLIVLVGGVIFMFAGVVDFPGVVPDDSPSFPLVVLGPQIVHGFLFWIANVLLTLSEQEKWYIPKVRDPCWQGAFLNASGGFWFMMSGFFALRKDELGAAAAEVTGSLAFFVGSLGRWYVVMQFC